MLFAICACSIHYQIPICASVASKHHQSFISLIISNIEIQNLSLSTIECGLGTALQTMFHLSIILHLNNGSHHAGLLVYIVYAVVQCVVLQPEPYYGVYDSDNWARARWFLLKRLGLAPGQSADTTPGAGFAMFNSTHISDVPGGANRWRLPQDTSGEACSKPCITWACSQVQ